jgi:hypothetical protein
MNEKEKNLNKNKNNNEKDSSLPTLNEIKVPFDMKIFWKIINDKYFMPFDPIEANKVNHLIKLYSKYGKDSYFIKLLDIGIDSIFNKIAFPKTLNSFLGKATESLSKYIFF